MLNKDEIIGAVKLDGKWRFFAGIIAEWIMDYQRYDPGFTIEENPNVFRDNILLVDENNAEQFCMAMQTYELNSEDLKSARTNQHQMQTVQILIDFDRHFYVSSFYDIELEKYIPENWIGEYGNPEDYIPPEKKKEFDLI